MTDDFRYGRKKYIANEDLIGKLYKEFYKPNSELGNWLSTKNIVEKIMRLFLYMEAYQMQFFENEYYSGRN